MTRILKARGLALIVGATLACAGSAGAHEYIGDLVYCDVDANGMYDGDDFPMNGVDVRVECVADNGDLCADMTATTGEVHPSFGPGGFMSRCGDITTWDPRNEEELDGRWAVDIIPDCSYNNGAPRPHTCTVTVDENTLPAECSGLVTPMIDSFPVDGNNDGDYCDLEDGPFPEDQLLGNHPTQGGCEEFPDPAPGDGQHTTIIDMVDECSLGVDFGYTGMPTHNEECKIDVVKTCRMVGTDDVYLPEAECKIYLEREEKKRHHFSSYGRWWKKDTSHHFSSYNKWWKKGDSYKRHTFSSYDRWWENGGDKDPNVEYVYTITNEGMTDLYDVTVEDDKINEIPGAPILTLPAGETMVLTAKAHITETTVNHVVVEAETAGGMTCEDAAQAKAIVKEKEEEHHHQYGCGHDGYKRTRSHSYKSQSSHDWWKGFGRRH